jgi:general stress protein YciG
MATNNIKRRGFASMDAERRREIARKGGKAAHQLGRAHEWDSDGARAAGRIGGRRGSAGKGRRRAE